MALERTYNIPLRKEFQKAPAYRRAKKAIAALREYVKKHMKTDDVLLGDNLNKEIWKNGIRNPPHHVKVSCVKEDDGTCKVELFGHKYVVKEKAAPKVKKAPGLKGKLQEQVKGLKEGKKESDEKKTEEDLKKEPEEGKKETAEEKKEISKGEKKEAGNETKKGTEEEEKPESKDALKDSPKPEEKPGKKEEKKEESKTEGKSSEKKD